jgi:ubiquinone/menaquinone biosynthesis C-methylase UbiE
MTQKTISEERFEKAQNYERGYWQVRSMDAVGILHDLMSPIELAAHLQKEGCLDQRFKRFLDLGCGGVGLGLLWLVQANEKHGIDPIPINKLSTGNQFLDNFAETVQNSVQYHHGKGENLPFENNYFDFIVCNNVLDHVHNPYHILSEIWRVLEPGGLFAFAVDTHSFKNYILTSLIKIINPDYGDLPGHPYHWTESQITKILIDKNFIIQNHDQRSFKGRLLGRTIRSTYMLVKPK